VGYWEADHGSLSLDMLLIITVLKAGPYGGFPEPNKPVHTLPENFC
jgi:hypothetical protein